MKRILLIYILVLANILGMLLLTPKTIMAVCSNPVLGPVLVTSINGSQLILRFAEPEFFLNPGPYYFYAQKYLDETISIPTGGPILLTQTDNKTSTIRSTSLASGYYTVWATLNKDNPRDLCTIESPPLLIGTPPNTPTPVPSDGVCRTLGIACSGQTDCCSPLECRDDTSGTNKCLESIGINDPIPTVPFDPCLKLTDLDKKACDDCRASDGAYTAIGCIPLQPGQFVAAVIRVLLVIGIGVAFLLIVYGAFLALTSRGNPQQTQASRETITAAIIGLLLLIFALVIVRIIFGPIGIIRDYVTIF